MVLPADEDPDVDSALGVAGLQPGIVIAAATAPAVKAPFRKLLRFKSIVIPFL
jgi:hypothetical protein